MRTTDLQARARCRAAALALLLLPVLLPAAADAQSAPAVEEHAVIVRAGDQLRIRVWPDSSLGGLFPVESDGSIHLPAIGDLPVAGLPLPTIRRELRSRYATALKNPVVSVSHLFRVSVLGAVQRPGLYEVSATHGLMDVISLAGGFRDDARESRVGVLRDGALIPFDARRAMEGGGEAFAGLESGDRIVVPEGWSVSVRDVLSAVQLLAVGLSLYFQLSDR